MLQYEILRIIYEIFDNSHGSFYTPRLGSFFLEVWSYKGLNAFEKPVFYLNIEKVQQF